MNGRRLAQARRRGVLLISCAGLLFSIAAESGAAGSLTGELRVLLSEEHLSGAVYAVVDGADTHIDAVGSANVATGIPMTPDTRVHVGSVVKPVLALGLMRLATEGRVDLDAPVEELLPGVRFNNAWGALHPVRVRHLLDHTAGLEDARFRHLFSRSHTPAMPLAGVFARDPGLLRVRTRPGTVFSYSNLGYTLAGMVIEAVTGERYESWADRELLPALGMVDSTFRFTTQRGHGADPRLAWGHLDDLSPVAAAAVAIRPAGQFTTTAADMARLTRFLMGDGTVNGATFIDVALLRAMGREVTTDAARAGLGKGYALGLATRDRHGVIGLWHGGGIVGFRAVLYLFPEQHRGFFMAHNTDSESANYGRFDAHLVHHLGVTTEAFPARTGVPAPAWSGRYVPSPSRFETFALLDYLGAGLVLDADARAPALTAPWGNPVPLLPVAENLYRQADRVRPSHVLLQDGTGARFLSDGAHTWRRVSDSAYAGVCFSVILGLAGLAWWCVMLPLRSLRYAAALKQPATPAMLLLLLPVPLFLLQTYERLGDPTPAAVALYGASAALPVLMLAQVAWTIRGGMAGRVARLDLLAALLVLQFCGLLAAWNLLPFALWR